MSKYIWGLDLSLKNSGIAIFDNDVPVYIDSIPTKDKDSHGVRLKKIYDHMLELKEKYPPDTVCIERGFSRFNASTAAINQVVGVVLLLLCEYDVNLYPPKTVKMIITGDGAAKKDKVMEKILNHYPDLKFENNDESDAVAVAMTYLVKKGIVIL